MNDTFFATIIGALVAFLGVLLTLRITQRNFETNLREEREKAREEREFSAKHKALLSAAESVTRFLNYYMTLSDRELPKDGTIPDEVSEMAITLNRLHFYCDMDTIKQSIAMSQILSRSYTQALKAKMPSIFIAEDIKVIDLQIAAMEPKNVEELLKSSYIRDAKMTIADIVKLTIAKIGENITIAKFSRLQLGV